MPNNEAAWLVAKHAPLQVKDAPYTEPGAGEILVSNHAVAVSPVDWFKPSAGDLKFNWIKYPFWRRLRGLAAQRPIVRV
jgi:NADPH:quinone reductase-like Zn-dependent oxidoreductase